MVNENVKVLNIVKPKSAFLTGNEVHGVRCRYSSTDSTTVAGLNSINITIRHDCMFLRLLCRSHRQLSSTKRLCFEYFIGLAVCGSRYPLDRISLDFTVRRRISSVVDSSSSRSAVILCHCDSTHSSTIYYYSGSWAVVVVVIVETAIGYNNNNNNLNNTMTTMAMITSDTK
ncbi:hypothetical protein AGLY_008019 [Aphis glycines]|uniref:Uncharacterized protein n=1 Tax=Aphis glycines TaxID=307491 RepID=A0A6G0TMU7_APHGL|nr:hypothetical protein AGLY_008019 [Aphis glycines]